MRQNAEHELEKRTTDNARSSVYQQDLDEMLTRTTSLEDRLKTINLLMQIKMNDLNKLSNRLKELYIIYDKMKNA